MPLSRNAPTPRDAPTRRLLAELRQTLDGDVYIVGGFLRDLLLRRPSQDLDLAVSGPAGPAAEAIGAALRGHVFPLDDERGQYRIALPDGAPVPFIDVSSLRGDVQADLALRDYTVDAMAAPLAPDGRFHAVIDPFAGLDDLRSRTVRLVRNEALVEDPLRLLRGPRIATELGFTIDPATETSITARASSLASVAAERLRDELCRVFATPRAREGLRLIDRLGLLQQLIPEITAARGVSQPKEHYWDVFDHSLETVGVLDWLLSAEPPRQRPASDLRPAFDAELAWFPLASYFRETVGGRSRLVLAKLAGLLHDVGKPETRAPDETGRIRFFGHAEAGARTAQALCRRLRFGNRETHFVSVLVDQHLRPTQLSPAAAEPSNRAIYRFFRDLGPAAPACLVLSLADAAAALGPRLEMPRWRGHAAFVSYILARHQALERQPGQQRLLSGDEIMSALAIGPGPLVGRLLAAVEEAAGSGEVESRSEALDYARSLYEAWEREPASRPAGGS